jgi:hypothetical protein
VEFVIDVLGFVLSLFPFYLLIDNDSVMDTEKINVEVDNIVSMRPFEPRRTEVKKHGVRRMRRHRTEETVV